jgi:DNA-binding response OmpR family regulator
MATVLVVEDDAAIANLVDANLRKEGHKVIHARSVGEAWQQVNAGPIAGAVVDLHLPGVYGWELVRRMRQDPRFRHVPVLIVSADLGEPERLEAEELGCDYLAKPFDLDEFLVKARTMIVRGRRIGRDKARVKLLLDAYEIEGTIHVEALDRFSEAWEALLTDDRAYIPVTDAVIKTIVDGRVIDSPSFVQVNKAELRAVVSLDALDDHPPGLQIKGD